MSIYREIEKLKSQIVDTKKMIELVGDHPLMSKSYKERLNILKEKLEKLPKNQTEAKIKLLFSGKAIKGSLGIKSKFVSKTIKPIQELIKAQAALIRFENIGKRGPIKKNINSELYLTSLPIGSFGVELSKLESDDLFDDLDVSNAILQVMELIESTTIDDDTFETIIDKTPKRNLTYLKKFLKAISDADSILKIETGSFGVDLNEKEIKDGFLRVNSTNNTEEEIYLNGILRGVLLDSGKFEFISEDGTPITGMINPDITEEQLIEYDRKYLNKNCKMHLLMNKTIFITEREKVSYELLSISD